MDFFFEIHQNFPKKFSWRIKYISQVFLALNFTQYFLRENK